MNSNEMKYDIVVICLVWHICQKRHVCQGKILLIFKRKLIGFLLRIKKIGVRWTLNTSKIDLFIPVSPIIN